MNKTELVDAIAKESGLTKTDSEKALNGFIKAVEDVLKTILQFQLTRPRRA